MVLPVQALKVIPASVQNLLWSWCPQCITRGFHSPSTHRKRKKLGLCICCGLSRDFVRENRFFRMCCCVLRWSDQVVHSFSSGNIVLFSSNKPHICIFCLNQSSEVLDWCDDQWHSTGILWSTSCEFSCQKIPNSSFSSIQFQITAESNSVLVGVDF